MWERNERLSFMSSLGNGVGKKASAVHCIAWVGNEHHAYP